MQKLRVVSMTRQKIMVIKQAGATQSPHHPCEQVAACNSLGDLIQLGFFFIPLVASQQQFNSV